MNLTAPKHQPNRTQSDKILELLRERGSSGVKCFEIPNNLGILQYGARVLELRRKGFNIINKDNTFYLIEGEPVQFGLAF